MRRRRRDGGEALATQKPTKIEDRFTFSMQGSLDKNIECCAPETFEDHSKREGSHSFPALYSNEVITPRCKQVKRMKEQLMDLMRQQLMAVIPDDRESFVELCIKKRLECAEKQFSGNHAVFSWRPGTSPEMKDRFWRTYNCVYKQDINKCPVDGGWTEWTVWSKCTADCEDKGWQTRTRACDNPKPAYGGRSCDGETVLNKTCVGLCRTSSDGLAEAEEYVVQVHEAFPDLAAMCLDKHCLYSEVLKIVKDRSKVDKYWSSINCMKYNSACPINGGWGQWSADTACSVVCGLGEKVRTRNCDKPVTRNGGMPCQGEWFEKSSCVARACSDPTVGLTEWSDFTPCSVSCGKYGVKTSTRYCLQATQCEINRQKVTGITKEVPCYGGECPQRGGWGQWQAWSECSADCGIGRKVRFRQCDSPYPSGGDSCFGLKIQTTACDGSLCIQLPQEEEEDSRRKRDISNYINSSSVDIISDSSFHLSKVLKYNLTAYKDQRNSKDFRLVSLQNVENIKCKSSVKEFNALSGNLSCSTPLVNQTLAYTKTINIISRRRIIPNLTTTKTLEGFMSDFRALFAYEEKLLGLNSAYIEFPKLRRTREVKVEQDDPFLFELNPGLENTYTIWTIWSACSASCGGGTRKKTRSCKDKTVVCRGEIKPTQYCNIDPCPVQGGWGAWQSWTLCSTTCGPGFTERYRPCDNPLPAFGGSCAGTNKESRDCNLGRCNPFFITWSVWSLWSACSKTCGGGYRKRSSFSSLPSFAFLQKPKDESVFCNFQPCPVNGLWAAWAGWTKCSEPCGRKQNEDDFGIKLEGNGYLRYPDKGKTTGFFMVFLRVKPVALMGTIFHQVRGCGKKLTNCDCSVMLVMKNGFLELEVKNKWEKQTMKLSYSNPLVADKWQDVLVVVTESWAEMRVDDDYRAEKPFSSANTYSFNFDGQLFVGSNRLGEHRFHGKIGALRRNFKMLLMFNTKSWSDYTVPSLIHNVKKVQMKATVRHPDFKRRFYSHLFFQETHYFHLTASFQITNTKGLILFSGGREPKSFISVAIVEASLMFCLSCGSKASCSKGYDLKTGEWYILRVLAKENEGQIRLNDGDALQIMCPSGEQFRPRNSVYIGGAGMNDWNVIVNATTNQTMFQGIIDTLKVNDLSVTYKMATLVDVNGLLNSLGYSLADYITEVYKNEKTITTLLCGVPEKTTKFHFVRIVWFENMRHLVPAAGVEIIDVESQTQVISKVNLYPEHAGEGIYACVVSQDGMLSVVHVFVVYRYKANFVESESRAEWIALIVLMVLILLCFCPGLCYCCTKDHPMWTSVRNFFNRIYCKITGKEFVEETAAAGEASEAEPADGEGSLGTEPLLASRDASREQLQRRPLKTHSQPQSKNQSETQLPGNSSQQQLLSQSQQQSGQPQQSGERKTSVSSKKQPQMQSKAQLSLLPPTGQQSQQQSPQSGVQQNMQLGAAGQQQMSTNLTQQCPPGYYMEPYFPTQLPSLSHCLAPCGPRFRHQTSLPGQPYSPYQPSPYSPYQQTPSSPSQRYSPYQQGPASPAQPYHQRPTLPAQHYLKGSATPAKLYSPYEQGPATPAQRYSRPPSLHPSITKLHVLSPSLSRERIAGSPTTRTPIHQPGKQGRMFICQPSDDEDDDQQLGSQRKGRKFICRDSKGPYGQPQQGKYGRRMTQGPGQLFGQYDQQLGAEQYGQQPGPGCCGQPCGPDPCDFVDQISVQIPPQRAFKAKATYPQTPCYYPHLACRPSFNPYALCSPYNTNASIPPIDLLANPFMMTPFRRKSSNSEPSKNKGQKKVSNKDLAVKVAKQSSNRDYMEDYLNFSENNSLNLYTTPIVTDNEIYVRYDAMLCTSDAEPEVDKLDEKRSAMVVLTNLDDQFCAMKCFNFIQI
ncbi:hypothetical protein Btru_029763 [Bulinus truncatus]|nr:hypothetical protein Btru_029763 [Bulinus truncatus]